MYGKNTNVPFHEDADLVLGPTTKGRWSYAASKALDEFLALSYWKEKGLPVVVARFFNTVGPRQTGRYGMVVPNFVGQALEGAPITVYGNGQQSRCFCDVRDAVEGILRLIATDKAVGEVVNMGNDQEMTIEGLAHLVKEKTASSSPIQFIPYDQAYEPGFEDMFRRVPCLDKLERLTGFRPTTPLPEIIDRVAAYHARKKAIRWSPQGDCGQHCLKFWIGSADAASREAGDTVGSPGVLTGWNVDRNRFEVPAGVFDQNRDSRICLHRSRSAKPFRGSKPDWRGDQCGLLDTTKSLRTPLSRRLRYRGPCHSRHL